MALTGLARRAGNAAAALLPWEDEPAAVATGDSLHELAGRLVTAAELGDPDLVASVLRRVRDGHPWVATEMTRVVLEGAAAGIPATPRP